MGIVEIVIFLIIALIVIPPEHLPEVMRAIGKILRELRLASNTVVRELSGVLEDPYYMQEQPRAPQEPHSSDASPGENPELPPQT